MTSTRAQCPNLDKPWATWLSMHQWTLSDVAQAPVALSILYTTEHRVMAPKMPLFLEACVKILLLGSELGLRVVWVPFGIDFLYRWKCKWFRFLGSDICDKCVLPLIVRLGTKYLLHLCRLLGHIVKTASIQYKMLVFDIYAMDVITIWLMDNNAHEKLDCFNSWDKQDFLIWKIINYSHYH